MKKYRKSITKKLGELPKYLVELINFEKIILKKYENTDFSSGFYLEYTKDLIEDFYWDRVDDEDSAATSKTIKKIKKKLIPFACVKFGNYAFWIQENKTIGNLPIVFISPSESYMEIVASNLEELMRLLSSGFEGVMYDDEYINTVNKEALDDYRNWLKNDLKIKPVQTNKEIDAIIQEAQDVYQKDFFDWLSLNGSDTHVNDY